MEGREAYAMIKDSNVMLEVDSLRFSPQLFQPAQSPFAFIFPKLRLRAFLIRGVTLPPPWHGS